MPLCFDTIHLIGGYRQPLDIRKFATYPLRVIQILQFAPALFVDLVICQADGLRSICIDRH